jgi:NADPH2:quinone reductase
MRIAVRAFGEPSCLTAEPFQIPTPGKNQILIKTFAAGINPVEAYRRTGTYYIPTPLPWTPGQDGAGVIESVGEGVDPSFKPGTRVWTSASETGTYAQYSISNQDSVQVLPESLTFEQGAALWTPYGTAYHAVFQVGEASLNGPNIILVHGASGGVGTACVQFARQIPNTIVIGTAGTPEGCERVLKLGAHYVFNHREENYMQQILEKTEGKGVDIICEMLANVNLGNDLKILSMRGRVVVIGSRGNVEITPRDLMGKRSSIRGLALFNATPDEKIMIKNGIQKGITDGFLNPVIGKCYSLDEAPQSHIDILDSSKGTSGKLVLLPWGKNDSENNK